MIFVLVGCTEKGGLNIGFENKLSYESIICAVKSEETEFNVDNIELSFNYGWNGEETYLSDENYEQICFALYFNNSEYQSSITSITTTFSDYQEIENFYFVKEVSIDDFFSSAFAVTLKRLSSVKFNHSENLIVPKEVFENKVGHFSFTIMEIYYSHKDNSYCLDNAGFVAVRYEIIDDLVVLSRPSSSI